MISTFHAFPHLLPEHFKGSFTIPTLQKLGLTEKRNVPSCGHLHPFPLQLDILDDIIGKALNHEMDRT
jgi:hypothetical protein